MRTEFVQGRHILCGAILPTTALKVGQLWAPASGGSRAVTVTQLDGDLVTYEGPAQPPHSKEAFAFQCRYCLVLPTAEIPAEML